MSTVLQHNNSRARGDIVITTYHHIPECFVGIQELYGKIGSGRDFGWNFEIGLLFGAGL